MTATSRNHANRQAVDEAAIIIIYVRKYRPTNATDIRTFIFLFDPVKRGCVHLYVSLYVCLRLSISLCQCHIVF